MKRFVLVVCSLAAIACGGTEPAPLPLPEPEPEPEPAPTPSSEPPPTAQPAGTVNSGHSCTADADCSDLTAIAPATWRCLGVSLLSRHGMPDGPEPRVCLHVSAESSLYCSVVDDCPPGLLIPAASESVSCVDHFCAYSGHVSDPQAR